MLNNQNFQYRTVPVSHQQYELKTPTKYTNNYHPNINILNNIQLPNNYNIKKQ
jgi:hypothetical protein